MKKKGFTLIELLVVISIIALLLSILLPSLSKAKVSARRVMCGTRLKSIHLAATLYASEDPKGKLPQGGMHTATVDYDDGIGIETHNYFKLTNYITTLSGLPLTLEAVNAMPTADLAKIAKIVALDGAGKIFVCPEVERGDKMEYRDMLFRENRRMTSVIFSDKTYARIGFCYLAGFETEKWDFDQKGAVARGVAAAWRSPSKMSDNGSWVLATDRARHVPAGSGWVNQDFLQLPHAGNGYQFTSPVGANFDYTKIQGGTNVLTLDGAVEHKKISNTKLRQIFNSTSQGGINHEDYTFF